MGLVLFGIGTWLLFWSLGKLLPQALGGNGIEGIVAFWIGMALLYVVGAYLGAW